ncbi:DUF421 domain-containing protein [Sporosarcina sp. Marseille-Q4063]|uniref:YetF domain-containing protein n=1 Tax=Sporosarcina sp. Marseille-Q4063 TaxID=2810514 RepID=UPI001BAEF79C|nr:DUF421 domain-containing protein [Sporosarcina sp. Marseille-Q4063]QUW23971.1 DUF421 domain-containing protein [Sporosarcina sp. Marseille-Q4063]
MIFRTTGAFIALLILARILGKKQLSQLTFFHYITGIAFGSIAAEIAGQTDVKFLNGITSLIWWAVLTLLASFISLKSSNLRIVLDDQPAIVIKEGAIMENAMKKERLHINDLMMMLREQSIFTLQDVHYAILETNGELSVMKKITQQGATKQDVKASTTAPKYLPTELISDGKVRKKNLAELSLTEEWLMKELRKKGVESADQVFLAQIQDDGTLFVEMKNPSR